MGFLLAVPMSAQSVPSAQVYVHFVGDWAGTDHYLDNGHYVTKPFSVHIAALRRGLQMDYLYGDGVHGPVEHVLKIFTLDPKREEMTTQTHMFQKQTYATKGLAVFARMGLGTFYATSRGFLDGSPVAYAGEFRLSAEEFSYTWYRATPSQTATLYSEFKMHRIATTPNP